MKKVTRSPTLEWRVGNSTNGRAAEVRFSDARAAPYDLKKAVFATQSRPDVHFEIPPIDAPPRQ